MSSNLCYRPVEDYKYDLSTEVKFMLRKVYGDPIDVTLSNSDIPFLTGLKTAGVKEAEQLIDAIHTHGEIELKEIF